MSQSQLITSLLTVSLTLPFSPEQNVGIFIKIHLHSSLSAPGLCCLPRCVWLLAATGVVPLVGGATSSNIWTCSHNELTSRMNYLKRNILTGIKCWLRLVVNVVECENILTNTKRGQARSGSAIRHTELSCRFFIPPLTVVTLLNINRSVNKVSRASQMETERERGVWCVCVVWGRATLGGDGDRSDTSHTNWSQLT